MVIYAFVPPDGGHASYYYRMITPLRAMEDLGLDVEIYHDDMSSDVPTDRRATGIMWSDIVWMYQATEPLMRRNIQVVSEAKGVQQSDGRVFLPANFVQDTDDNLFAVTPTNPAYRTLGTRMPDGTPLHPGASVVIPGEDGKSIFEWKDGERGFDIARNIAHLEDYRAIGQAAGNMTCSTPEVEKYVKKEFGKGINTFVNYNAVRFSDYQDVALVDSKEIRIFYQSSSTHYEDFFYIKDALVRVLKKYPQAKLVVWGVPYEAWTKDIPQEQYEYIPWVRYDQYKYRLVTINPDINLCPLLDTPFGRTRSAIKFYESTLLHTPAVTLAQRTGAYAAEIEDGKTGMLYSTPEEFEHDLSTLIENETLRKELAANAKDWLHENRDALKLAPKLYEYFQEIRAKKRETCEIEVADGPVPTEHADVQRREGEGS